MEKLLYPSLGGKMKITLLKMAIGCLLIAAFSSGRAFADSGANPSFRKVCVLNFERPEHPVTPLLSKVFQGHTEVAVHNLALPLDFLDCVRNRSTEIVIIGHALLTPNNPMGQRPVDLGYFLSLCGSDRNEAISGQLALLSEIVNDISRQYYKDPHPVWYNPKEQALAKEYQKLEKIRDDYENYPPSRPYYVLNPILPKVMSLVRSELDRQAASTDGIALRRIRLMSCLPDEVLAQYDDLRALIQEHGISLDVAPSNPLLSAIEGMPVTNSLNESWLRKSIAP